MWTQFPTSPVALTPLQPWPGKYVRAAELCAPQGRLCEPRLGLIGVFNEKILKNARKSVLMIGGVLKWSS